MRYNIVARLMAMRDEEIQEMKENLIEMLRYNEEKKALIEGAIDYSKDDYDSYEYDEYEEWSEYEEVLYIINDWKKYLEDIEDFYENYDYYFDFDVEECDDDE